MISEFYIKSDYLEPHEIFVKTYGKSSNPSIFLLHGFINSHIYFENLAKNLASDEYFVITPDFAGRGKSSHLENYKNYNYDLYVHDLRLIFNHFNIDKSDILGTSMGGLVAIFFAEKSPTMLNKIILNDIGEIIENIAILEIGSDIDKEASQESPHFDKSIRKIFWNGEKQKKIPTLDFSKSFQKVFNRKKTEEIALIRGEKSNFFSQKNFEDIIKKYDIKNHYTIPNAFHAPLLKNAYECNLIRNFLKK